MKLIKNTIFFFFFQNMKKYIQNLLKDHRILYNFFFSFLQIENLYICDICFYVYKYRYMSHKILCFNYEYDIV